jgi:beta-aspartyl-peptidase (threonine type)
MSNNWLLVIHGGAGTILRQDMSAEKESHYRNALQAALETGYALLSSGNQAIDVVEETVRLLEDHPLFNAGKGSVFTHEGQIEMDAAIMDGSTLGAGSVAQVSNIKNPISAAKAVMQKSQHVLLVGKGAEQFAKEQGIELASRDYFFTKERWNQLQLIKSRDGNQVMLDHDTTHEFIAELQNKKDGKFGTVGAVALDKKGNLAAATSTGGMTNKKFGRVGDSAIIGAGTYANNATCAVSCTGWGEYFMRTLASKSISDLMEYKGLSLKQACDAVIHEMIPKMGGDGGLIAVDCKGNFAMPFNTDGMYRGYVLNDGIVVTEIYRNE